MTRSMVITSLILVLIVLALVPAELRNTWLSGSWSPVQFSQKYKGRYFRIKVSLVYKGEPQDFNVVYGCNVNYVKYKDGASTSEIGLVPALFGRRMSDGKGLTFQAPQSACEDHRKPEFNPRLRKNFMPLVVVYDNADELGFGTAYISDDAYASPDSELKFVSASIEAATREEFDDFRSNGPPNLVRRETYHADNLSDESAKALGIPPIRPLDELPGLGYYCEAYARFKVAEDTSRVLAKYWPSNKPIFWEAASISDAEAMRTEIKGQYNLMVARDDEDKFQKLAEFDLGASHHDWGIRRRGDVFSGDPSIPYVPPSFYPSYHSRASHFLPRDWQDLARFLLQKDFFLQPAIDMKGGAMRGKGYCFRPSGPKDNKLWPEFLAKKRIVTVDGEQVQLNPTKNDGLDGSLYFFERDQYMWITYRFGVGSTRGDL